MKINKTFIAKLTNDPEGILKTMHVEEIVELIQKANHEYYNKAEPLFDDQIFDIIKEYLAVIEPGHPVLYNVGATVDKTNKVTLPFYMGSLDKIKNDEKVFSNWKKNYVGNYVISDKLDGNSGLLVFKNNELQMYSRGNGIEGQNITHLLPFLKNKKCMTVDQFTRNGENIAVRGELIMSKQDFNDNSNKGANARNIVAGLMNAKIPDLNIAKLTSFVAYEVLFPKMKPKDQMHFIKNVLKIDCVYNEYLTGKQLILERLSETLVDRRNNSSYEIDGIVVSHNEIYDRVEQNPEHSFAFKSVITMEKAEVIVTKVEWNMSKDGFFVPIVHFTPVNLDGVVIAKAHGFNGKFIKDNMIAPGAVIIVIRSGAVIPYIVEVVKKASKPQMPETPFIWSKTNVDIQVDISSISKDDSDELQFKNIEYFFNKIDVPGLSTGIIARIFNKGFKTVGSITNITKEQLLTIDGFKEKLAHKIETAIQNSFKNDIDVYMVMDASNVLGRGIGYKKIKLICDNIPDIVEKRYIPTLQQMVNIKGIESKTAELFIDNLPKLLQFFDDNGLSFQKHKIEPALEATTATASLRVQGKTFVFSGVRDKDLELFITNNGGHIGSAISSKTHMLIVKEVDSESSKITKAKSLGVVIMTYTDFKAELVL
jgi:DNA ligase (NAD+)